MFNLVRPVTAADITEFVEWRYGPPYDIYNLSQPLAEAVEYFLSPGIGCQVLETDEGLAGYCTFGEDARVPGGDYSIPALDIGVALKPTLTGRGYGTRFVAAIVDFVMRSSDAMRVRVSIAATNTRAIRVWIANGLAETQRFHTQREVLGTTEFVILERDLAAEASEGA